MRAIWREAAVTRAPHFSRQKCASRFTTAAPPIARKRDSYKGFRRSPLYRNNPGIATYRKPNIDLSALFRNRLNPSFR